MYSPFAVPVSPRDFHDRIYGGEIARFAGLAPMGDLVAFTRGMLEDAFAPHAPVEIHRHLSHARQTEVFADIEKIAADRGLCRYREDFCPIR
jgi:hypothetical protein